MSYICGIPDNILNFASTSALSAYDVSLPVNGAQVSQGQLAAVTGGYMYIYEKSILNQRTANGTTILTATGGGQWQEYFLVTGQTYILISDTDNTISLGNNGGIVNADIAANAAIAFSKLATLSSNHILAGVAGVATDCAVAGDLALSAASTTATFTISNLAVTTAKIGTAAVTLAKLAPGITPAAILSAAGTGSYAGGSATATFTISGLTAGDLVLAQIATSANAVSIQKVSFSGTTVSVLCSGDPGASTFTYHVARAAS